MLLVFSELPPHTTCFFAFLMIIDFTILCFTDNCRAMLCRRGLCRHAVYVCVSACLSRSWILSKRINISSFFSPSDSHTIPDFSHQTSRQYSDGNPLPHNGSVECRWAPGGVCRNRDSEPISGSIACCERQVQYTQLRRTMAS